MELALTGVGVSAPSGDDPAALIALITGAAQALTPCTELAALPDDRAGVVSGPDLRPWLKRRKDQKLLARPAALALAAAGRAIAGWPGDRTELGLFLGVGREPDDARASEPALAAAYRAGRLDGPSLAGPGRDLYPPLLPLVTLPNMALAHVSINFDIRGQNATWAGGAAAGLRAVLGAMRAVEEGRAPAALAGGSDSLVDLWSARDRLRLGQQGPPGEAAAFLCIEPLVAARARSATVLATLSAEPLPAPVDLSRFSRAIGDCGAALGVVALACHAAACHAAACHAAARGALAEGPALCVQAQDGDQPPVSVTLRIP